MSILSYLCCLLFKIFYAKRTEPTGSDSNLSRLSSSKNLNFAHGPLLKREPSVPRAHGSAVAPIR